MQETACVILAAGRGKRMPRKGKPKACADIGGRAAIVRAIDTYKAAGLRRFVVVVGHRGAEVRATVSAAHPKVRFVRQRSPRGTGHAAGVAVEMLAGEGHHGPVLVVMGDKIPSVGAVAAVLRRFAEPGADAYVFGERRRRSPGGTHKRRTGEAGPEFVCGGFDGARGREADADVGLKHTQASLVCATQSGRSQDTCAVAAVTTVIKSAVPTAGRVVAGDDGRALAIVEAPEIAAARRAGKTLHVAGQDLTPAEIERRSPTVNASQYVFRFDRLREALAGLRADNAQGELYLTDTVEPLAARGRVVIVALTDPRDLMTFNTPAELRAVRREVRRRQAECRVRVARRRQPDPKRIKTAGDWRRLLTGGGEELRRAMARLYGSDATVWADRRKQMLRVVRAMIAHHGDRREMILVRAPGRVNLLGRHVDHRGGTVNVMAIGPEVLLAAAPRADRHVSLRHCREKDFPARALDACGLPGVSLGGAWSGVADSAAVGQFLAERRGDWAHYARAALLRLRHEAPEAPLAGMDCVLDGDVPMGAGLSSSSAMVVAVAAAAARLNGLSIRPGDFVDLCGEGEWFVGSRGGSADHAAIRLCRRGRVSRFAFEPFRSAGEVRLPPDLRVVVAHSGAVAVKSAGARDVFNQRVACYEIGMLLLRRRWRAAAGAEHLRDLTPEKSGLSAGRILRGLTRLPVRPTRAQLRRMVPPADRDRLEELLATHADVGPYDLRGVMLFGLGECLRAERFAELLSRGDLAAAGRDIRTSHDGDRVVRWSAAGAARRHVVRTDDATLERLAGVDGLDLGALPGRYACSTEAVDRLVDLANSVDGVVGAQLAGAGLGGCATILVHDAAAAALLRRLRRDYYHPLQVPPEVHVCTPVAGAGAISI